MLISPSSCRHHDVIDDYAIFLMIFRFDAIITLSAASSSSLCLASPPSPVVDATSSIDCRFEHLHCFAAMLSLIMLLFRRHSDAAPPPCSPSRAIIYATPRHYRCRHARLDTPPSCFISPSLMPMPRRHAFMRLRTMLLSFDVTLR